MYSSYSNHKDLVGHIAFVKKILESYLFFHKDFCSPCPSAMTESLSRNTSISDTQRVKSLEGLVGWFSV